MKAVVLKDFGDSSMLQLTDIPIPEVQADEVLVEVYYTGLNPVDVKTRNGKGQAAHLRNQKPMILGWDISGIVRAVGHHVRDFSAGDEVFGIIRLPGHGRAYASYVSAPATDLVRKPDNIGHDEAAAAGIAALTAFQAILRHGNIGAGQRVLIQGASGGVGHYAVQIARSAGAHVTASASATNLPFIQQIGADAFVEAAEVFQEQHKSAFDFVLDPAGGDNIGPSLSLLKPGGTLVSLPSGISETVGSQAAEQGKRGVFFMVRPNPEDMAALARMLHTGVLRTYVTGRYLFDDIAIAHNALESGKVTGKLVARFSR